MENTENIVYKLQVTKQTITQEEVDKLLEKVKFPSLEGRGGTPVVILEAPKAMGGIEYSLDDYKLSKTPVRVTKSFQDLSDSYSLDVSDLVDKFDIHLEQDGILKLEESTIKAIGVGKTKVTFCLKGTSYKKDFEVEVEGFKLTLKEGVVIGRPAHYEITSYFKEDPYKEPSLEGGKSGYSETIVKDNTIIAGKEGCLLILKAEHKTDQSKNIEIAHRYEDYYWISGAGMSPLIRCIVSDKLEVEGRQVTPSEEGMIDMSLLYLANFGISESLLPPFVFFKYDYYQGIPVLTKIEHEYFGGYGYIFTERLLRGAVQRY